MVTPPCIGVSTLCTLLLLQVVVVSSAITPPPSNGGGGELDLTWSEEVQARFEQIDNDILVANNVIGVINGFTSLSPPERQSANDVWLAQLTEQVSSLMDSRSAAAKRIAAEVERLYQLENGNWPVYQSTDPTTWDFSFTSSLVYDSHYKTNVSYNFSTVRYPDFAASSDDLEWSTPLDKIFSDNYKEDPTLQNQYFAAHTGHLRAFPGGPWVITPPPNTPWDGNNPSKNQEQTVPTPSLPLAGFNAKFTPWYVLGASGPKDIVLVLDSSASMGNLYDVRKAAISVLNGLTDQDYVNIVTFNSYAIVSSCWQTRLIRATEANKQILRSYVMDLETATGKTEITGGLKLALKILETSTNINQSSNCEQVILLMTDGVTSATHFDIDNTIGARLFAYVLNAYTDTTPLQRLTCANSGILIPVPNPAGAYQVMSSYYTILAPGRDDSAPMWFGPYVNQYTQTGLVMTVLLPCFDRSESPPKLIGVVGIDLPVDQIGALVRNYVASPSYAFLTNHVGEALIHPSLPVATEYKSIPTAYDIAELENMQGNPNFAYVRSDLIQGLKNKVQIDRVTRQPKGYKHYEGMSYLNTTSQYYYQSLRAGKFSVAIVWNTLKDAPPPSFRFPVHRLPVTHVEPDSYHAPQQGNQLTSFAVSAKGFCDPLMFLTATREDNAFAEQVLQSVDDTTINGSCPDELLKPEARFAIQSTSHMDNLWNNSLSQLYPQVKVRFIATHYSGVMRTFPGKELSTKYDPTSVTWYRKAVAYGADTLVVSTPHATSDAGDVLASFDDATHNTVVLTRLITYATRANVSVTYGVMGLTLDYNYLSTVFLESFDNKCTYDRLWGQPGSRCFLIDGSGFVITHPSFLYALPTQNESYIFVGTEEPHLTRTLIRDNILVSKSGVDYSSGTKLSVTTYTVHDSALTSRSASNSSYKRGNLIMANDCNMEGTYLISKIRNTNLYMVVFNVSRYGVCSYNPITITSREMGIEACETVPPLMGPGTCAARRLSYSEMEEMRGIQKCKSETSAVILGVLIPLGIGAAVLGTVWLLRRRKRMRSMRAGMLVPNAENNNNNDDQHPPNENNENNNPDEHNQNEAINAVDGSLPLSSVNVRISPSYVINPINPNPMPLAPPNAANPRASLRQSTVLRQNSAQLRPTHASMLTTPPIRRNSASGILNTTSNNNYISPFYNMEREEAEGDEEDDEDDYAVDDGRGIAMHALPQPALAPADLNAGSHVDRALGENNEESEDEDNDDDDDESEGGSEESDSREERDPDDLFASMAREMGIPLPRTSGRT